MAFSQLPIETNIHIASYLDDQDIASFACICRETHDAVSCNSSPLWRMLFDKHFDLPAGQTNNALRATYQRRKAVLRRYCYFIKGLQPKEKEALEVIRELIVESYAAGAQHTYSNNITAIERFCNNSTLLHDVLQHKCFNKQTNPLLIAVQVLLTHIRFDMDNRTPTYSFYDSQLTTYRHPHLEPMFGGKDRVEINMRLVLHGLNFFKHYCTTRHAALEDPYDRLPKSERVGAWARNLPHQGACRLGKTWKGIYAYLDDNEIQSVRSLEPEDDLEDRWCDNSEVFQTLEVDHVDPETLCMPWPRLFERHLRALDHPSLKRMRKLQQRGSSASIADSKATRAQVRARPYSFLQTGPDTDDSQSSTGSEDTPPPKPHKADVASDGPPLLHAFQASGVDEESFLASGWVSALPPQQGIPGWQRFTMMKFFVPDGFEDDTDLSRIADMAVAEGIDGLWAYEGVVLPGGNVIVGRWWSPTTGDGLGLEKPEEADPLEPYSGPFLWWCTDPTVAGDP